MERKNKFARTYFHGQSLSEDFRRVIIDTCIEHNRNKDTAEISRGVFAQIAAELIVSSVLLGRYGSNSL